MDPYSADNIKRRKDDSFFPGRALEKVFKPVTSQIDIPGTKFRIQFGLIDGKWASVLLRDKKVIDTYIYKEEDLSSSGFPNQNLIVGWVLRLVAIPDINPHGIIKLIQTMRKSLMDNRGDHLPYPSIFKPPEPPDDIGVVKNVQRKSPVKEEEPEVDLFCRYCGSKLAMDERFCSVCGKKS